MYHVLVYTIVGCSNSKSRDHRFYFFPLPLMKYEMDITQTLIPSIHMTVAVRKKSNNCIETNFYNVF